MGFFDRFRKPLPAAPVDLGKLKVVRFHLVGGQTVEIDGVVDATFKYSDVDGSLVSWNLKFDLVEDHRQYPVFFKCADVSAITTEEYKRVAR